MNDCESLLRGGEVRDKKVYFRVAYDIDIDPEQMAFKAGMAMWNRHSKTTGFRSSNATTSERDFRLQGASPSALHLHLKARSRDDAVSTYEVARFYHLVMLTPEV